jgi:amino acid transporter
LPQFIEPFRDVLVQQQISTKSLDALVFVDTTSSLIKNFLFLLVLLSFFAEFLALTLICLILLMLRKNSKKYSRNTYRLHIQLTLVLLAQVSFFVMLFTNDFLVVDADPFDSRTSQRICGLFLFGQDAMPNLDSDWCFTDYFIWAY